MASLAMNGTPGESSSGAARLSGSRAGSHTGSKQSRRALVSFLRRLGGVLIVTGIWEAIAVSGAIRPQYLSTVQDTVKAIGRSHSQLLHALAGTLAVWGIGLGLAAIAGIILGAIVGSISVLSALSEWCVRGLRVLPGLALIPVAILVLGLTYRMQAVLVAFAAFWPIFVSAQYAVRNIDRTYIETSKTLNLSTFRLCWKVIAPASMPLILSAIRTGIGLAMAVVISVELVVGQGGLGGLVLVAQQTVNTPLIYAGIVVGGATGWLITLIFDAWERRAMHWNHRSGGARR